MRSRRQLRFVHRAIQRQGVTIVPLQIYFNKRGMAKVELGLATGKKQYDKRDAEREKDWKREQGQIMKRHNKIA